MVDTRVRIPLNGKKIDLDQLTTEVGAPLTASDTELVVANPDSQISPEVLSAKLAAHTPVPKKDPHVILLERIEKLEKRIDNAANANVAGDAAKVRDGLKAP